MAARFLLLAIAVALSVAQVWAQTAEELFEHGRKYHVGEGVELDLAKAQARTREAQRHATVERGPVSYTHLTLPTSDLV